MSKSDMAYLSASADIIQKLLSSVQGTLDAGSRCLMERSRRGARKDAHQVATLALDRLNALIEELGEGL